MSFLAQAGGIGIYAQQRKLKDEKLAVHVIPCSGLWDWNLCTATQASKSEEWHGPYGFWKNKTISKYRKKPKGCKWKLNRNIGRKWKRLWKCTRRNWGGKRQVGERVPIYLCTNLSGIWLTNRLKTIYFIPIYFNCRFIQFTKDWMSTCCVCICKCKQNANAFVILLNLWHPIFVYFCCRQLNVKQWKKQQKWFWCSA